MEAFFSRHHPAQHAASRAQEEGCQQILRLPLERMVRDQEKERKIQDPCLQSPEESLHSRELSDHKPSRGFSTVESSINSYKPQKCGIFLSNFIFLYVACVACLWYNGLEVIMIEALF